MAVNIWTCGIILCLLTLGVADLNVSIVVSSTKYYIGITDQMTVTCQINKNTSDKITSVILLRAGPNMSDYEELATLAEYVGLTTVHPEVQTRGYFNNTDTFSYLEVFWDYPDSVAEGLYKCEVSALSGGIFPETFSALAHIQAEAPTIDQFARLMRTMSQAYKTLKLSLEENNKLTQSLSRDFNISQNEFRTLRNDVQHLSQNVNQSQNKLQKLEREISIIDIQDAFQDNTTSGDRKYYISKRLKTLVNESEDICELFGGYLAEIDNFWEFETISRFLNTTSGVDYVVVSGTDEVVENQWVWHHSQRAMTFARWYTSAVDNWREPNSGPSHNCIMLYRKFEWNMLDTECYHNAGSLYFLCEMPIRN